MMNKDEIVRWHVFFSGEVQAVGFRVTAAGFARSLRLTGWVQNLVDGRVEMEAQGTKEALMDLLIQLKNHPPIEIEDYQIKQVPVKDGEISFRITG